MNDKLETIEPLPAPTGSAATCEYWESYPKQCGKPATHDVHHEHGAEIGRRWEPLSLRVAVCDYHAAISEHWGFDVRKRQNSVLGDTHTEANRRK